MDVIVRRSGGFAGLRLTWRVDVDELPDRDEWGLLIAELPWGEVGDASESGRAETAGAHQAGGTSPAPDRFVYDIECDPHRVTLAEGQLTGPWRELVDRVRSAAQPG